MTLARAFRFGAVTVAATALAACATLTVGTYVERGVDLARYQTYAWGPAEAFATGDPRLDNNTFFLDHLQGAIAKRLEARGYRLAASGAAPDLLVHFHANVTQDVYVAPAAASEPYDVGGRAFVFDKGMLTIDLMDARTRALVWRGWEDQALDGAINNQAWLDRRVDETVARILQRLPPRL